MRVCHFFIDWGDGEGWRNHTDSAGDAAALAAFTIEWGSDDPSTAPDASVLHIQVNDRTGRFAGRVAEMLGCRVRVQITRTPTWLDLQTTAPGTLAWSTTDGAWSALHEDYMPAPDAQPDERGITLFDGTITTGGKVNTRESGWIVDLYATSLMVQLQRDTAAGPVNGERQWSGTPAELVAEIRKRLSTVGVWDMTDETAQRLAAGLPDAMGGWKTDETVSLRDALDQLTNWHPHIVQWYDVHTGAQGDRIEPFALGAPARLILHEDGGISVRTVDGREQDAQPGSAIQVNPDTFTVPDPVSAIEIKGRTGDDDATVTLTAADLPGTLALYGSTVGIGGTIDLTAWSPDDEDRADAALLIRAFDTRLRPDDMTVDTRHVSLEDYPSLFTPAPSLWAILQSAYADLYTSEGVPSVAGPWASCGGTVTYTWRDHRPVLTSTLSLTPLPLEWDDAATWGGISIPLAWTKLRMAWAEFALMTFENNE